MLKPVCNRGFTSSEEAQRLAPRGGNGGMATIREIKGHISLKALLSLSLSGWDFNSSQN